MTSLEKIMEFYFTFFVIDFLQLINSALTVLRFLTKDIVCSRNPIVKKISLSSFSEQTAALLALILNDLDHEKANTETGEYFLIVCSPVAVRHDCKYQIQ